MAATPPGMTSFGEAVRGFERALELQAFAELGRRPGVRPAWVVVCFADIRGFTKFVEQTQRTASNRAAEFLRDFFSIFPRAVLREAWELEPDDPQTPATTFQQSVRRLIFPSLAKKLGDGVLLVWEVDANTDDLVVRGLRYAILDIVGYVQEYFYRLTDQIKLNHPNLQLDMHFGIGLASGQAWRLDYGFGKQIDYAGTPMNLAARLQDKARPNGIWVQASFAPTYLLERAWTGEGKIEIIELDGIRDPVAVWLSTKPTLFVRRSRKIDDNDSRELQVLLAQPYVSRPPRGSDEEPRRGFCPEDMRTLLQIREDLEASFAKGAAQRMSASADSELWNLIGQMKALAEPCDVDSFREAGQSFHEAIARLSGREKESNERVAMVHDLHFWTTRVYPQEATDRVQIIEEHSEIAQAITDQSPDVAFQKMQAHLRRHHERVQKKAFGSSLV
jgi:class 3 adenylate cyclase